MRGMKLKMPPIFVQLFCGYAYVFLSHLPLTVFSYFQYHLSILPLPSLLLLLPLSTPFPLYPPIASSFSPPSPHPREMRVWGKWECGEGGIRDKRGWGKRGGRDVGKGDVCKGGCG